MLNTKPPGLATNAVNRQLPQQLGTPGIQAQMGSSPAPGSLAQFPGGLGATGMAEQPTAPGMLGVPPPNPPGAAGSPTGMVGGSMGAPAPQPSPPGGLPGGPSTPMGAGGSPMMGMPPQNPMGMQAGGMPGMGIGGPGGGIQSGQADPQVAAMVNALAKPGAETPTY